MSLTRSLSDFIGVQVCSSPGRATLEQSPESVNPKKGEVGETGGTEDTGYPEPMGCVAWNGLRHRLPHHLCGAL